MSRSRSFLTLSWFTIIVSLVFVGSLKDEHTILAAVLLIIVTGLLLITLELEKMNSYDRGKIEGYRSLLTEIVKTRGVDERS